MAMRESDAICDHIYCQALCIARHRLMGGSLWNDRPVWADGVKHGIDFSAKIKNIAAQEPFPDLQDRLVGIAEITERIALERKSIMVREHCYSYR